MKTYVELKTAKEDLIQGMNILADAVKVTMGAGGKTVIIEDRYGNPKITKDGVTVAKNVYLKHPRHNMGALVLRQAASKTADDAGDGTTTSTVIAQQLVNQASKVDTSKYLLSEVKKGMELATDDIIEFLEKNSVKVTPEILLNIATISANNDEHLGKVIAEAFEKSGENGVVLMEDSKTENTYVGILEGMEIDRGYASRFLVNQPEKERCVLENCLVFVSEIKIEHLSQIQHILEFAIHNQKALLIIADMDDDVLATITLNKLKGGMKVLVVKPPMVGTKRKDLMQDLGVLTGATVANDETGDNFENLGFDTLGGCKKVSADKHKTSIVATKVDDGAVEKHVEQLKAQLEESKIKEEQDWLRERIAKLLGGVAIVYVGASSEIELEEKKDRVDDAIHATKAAIQEGIVAGGGIALLDASYELSTPHKNKNIKKGYSLMIDAIRTPAWQIIANSGKMADDIINEIVVNGVSKNNYGYDVKKERFGDMLKMGIIDPLKVTKNALRNAVSVASTIMQTEVTITLDNDE